MTPVGELRVGVGDLLGRPGARHLVERELRSEELTVTGSSIPAGSTIKVDLVIEATADYQTLTVTGTVAAPWRGECRRCLDIIEGELEAEVREVVARHPIDDQAWELEGDEIDIGAMARESLMLAMPLAPLCGPDCAGPAPEDFPTSALTDEGGVAEQGSDHDQHVDPRWAALSELRFDDDAADDDQQDQGPVST